MTGPRKMYDIPRAMRAIRELFADPEDTRQVFHIIESLSGSTALRMRKRFLNAPDGPALLRDTPDIVALLQDREALRRMPEGSLAHAYLEFVESEGITADGLMEASETGSTPPDRDPQVQAELEFIGSRMRDTHDLWHAATGYRGDLVGEASLLAFNIPQTWNPGIAFIVMMGFVFRGRRMGARKLMLDGFRRGLKAEYLPAVRWEELLAKPLSEVRELLNIEDPPQYQPIRSTDVEVVGTGPLGFLPKFQLRENSAL